MADSRVQPHVVQKELPLLNDSGMLFDFDSFLQFFCKNSGSVSMGPQSCSTTAWALGLLRLMQRICLQWGGLGSIPMLGTGEPCGYSPWGRRVVTQLSEHTHTHHTQGHDSQCFGECVPASWSTKVWETVEQKVEQRRAAWESPGQRIALEWGPCPWGPFVFIRPELGSADAQSFQL